MRRFLFNSLALVSFVLCIAIAILWVQRRTLPANAKPSTSDAQLTLSRRVPAVRTNRISLLDALDYFRDVSGARLIVDWHALASANIERHATVRYTATNVRFGEVLAAILASGDSRLQFTTEGKVLYISVKNHPRNPDAVELRSDPESNPILKFELQQAKSRPPPPLPPKPVFETVFANRRWTLCADRGILRLWATPPDPAAIY